MAKRSKSKVRGASARPGPVSQTEVPTLRARLTTAVAGGLVHIWRWLQRSSIGRLVGYVLAQRGLRLHPSAASHNNTVQGVDPAADLPGVARVQAIWFEKKRPQPLGARAPDAAAANPAPSAAARPARRLHVVDDIEVPLDQENQYGEYCRRAMICEGRSSLCHMCVFEEQRVPNGIVPNSGMIKHCSDCHKRAPIRCTANKCQVRFRGNRDRRLHIYFFHELSKGWWLERH